MAPEVNTVFSFNFSNMLPHETVSSLLDVLTNVLLSYINFGLDCGSKLRTICREVFFWERGWQQHYYGICSKEGQQNWSGSLESLCGSHQDPIHQISCMLLYATCYCHLKIIDPIYLITLFSLSLAITSFILPSPLAEHWQFPSNFCFFLQILAPCLPIYSLKQPFLTCTFQWVDFSFHNVQQRSCWLRNSGSLNSDILKIPLLLRPLKHRGLSIGSIGSIRVGQMSVFLFHSCFQIL